MKYQSEACWGDEIEIQRINMYTNAACYKKRKGGGGGKLMGELS